MQRPAVDTFCELLILALITQTLVSVPVVAAAAAAASTASAQTQHHIKRRAIEGALSADASSNDRDIALSSDSLELKLADVAADDVFHVSGESENVAAVKSTKLLPQVGSNRADDYRSSGKLVLNRVETGNAAKMNENEWSHLREAKTSTETNIAATEQRKASDLETSATTEAKVYSHGNVAEVAHDYAKGLAIGGISNGLDETAMQHNDEELTMQVLKRAKVSTTTEEILPEIERVAVKPSVSDDTTTTVAPGVFHIASAEAVAVRALQHSNENDVEEVTVRAADGQVIANTTAILATDVVTSTTLQPLTLGEMIMLTTTQTGELAKMQMPPATTKTETDSNQATVTVVGSGGGGAVGGGSSSEKRAKFINDNSTNAQQMNLPDAAEVWSLAGLKTVPKANNTESDSNSGNGSGNLANASQEKGNEIAIDTTERPVMNDTVAHSNSEKNLLDWTQIMMHGGFEGKRFNNLIEGGTTLRSVVSDTNSKEISLERMPTEDSTTNTATTQQSHFNAQNEGESTTTKVKLHEATTIRSSERIVHSTSTHLPDVLNEVALSHAHSTAAPTSDTIVTSSVTHLSADNADKQLEAIGSNTEPLNKTAAVTFTTEAVGGNESAGKMDDNNAERKTNAVEHDSIDVVTSTTLTATPLPTLSSAEHMTVTQTPLPVVELHKTSSTIVTTTPSPITLKTHSDGDDDYDYGNDNGNSESGSDSGSDSSMTTTTKAPAPSAVTEKVNIVKVTSTNNTLDDVTLEQHSASETTTMALAVSTLEASEASSTTASAVTNDVNATTPPTTGGILQHEKNRVASETTTNRAEIGNGNVLTTAPTVLPTKFNTNTNQPNINTQAATTTTEINQFGNEVELEVNTERITGSSTIKTQSASSNSSTSVVVSDIDGHDDSVTSTTITTIPTATTTNTTATASSINELLIPAAETSTTTSSVITTTTTTTTPKIIATTDSTTSAAPVTTAEQPVSPEPTTTIAAGTTVAATEAVVTTTATATATTTATPTIRESFETVTHLPLETTTTTPTAPTTGSVADINSTEIVVETTKPTPITIVRNKPDESGNSGGSHDTESSIETNAIDQLDKSTVKTPASTITDSVTTVTYKELEKAGPNTEPTNALGEVDTHNEQNFANITTTAATTTNTMATTITQQIPVAITTTTTEPPLINLLDDTTTTTWRSTAASTTTTISSIATKIQEIYSVFSSTPSTDLANSETINTTTASTTASTAAPTVAPLPPVLHTTQTPEVVTTTTKTMLQATTETILHSSIGGGGMPPTNLPGMQHPRNPGETDVNVIIAITVSVIGVIALILLVAFLYLIRKRQKQMSYGQRCRPVSLDAYSLDNVSVLGSVRRKGALRASKRSYGNIAFDDPSLRHNVLTAAELAQFVGRRSSIFEEFRDVPQITARADEVPHGCEDKNRYANVIPLPETRVILQQLNDDEKTEYINANYVRGPKDAPNYYIATQAPLETTVADFWRMIWEQQSRVIIQATDLIENGIEKCAEYLPPSVTLDNHATYGDFQITLKHREVKDKYAISTLMLKHIVDNDSRELTHYWYKWPETGVPNEEAPIIAMLLEARSSLKGYANEQKDRASSATLRADSNGDLASSVNSNGNGVTVISVEGGGGTPERKDGDVRIVNGNGNSANANVNANGSGEINGNVTTDKLKMTTTLRNQGPLTIHCSPGIGRTGTIIACDMAIRSLETPKRSVDIPQIVYYVRRGRASAVQTKEQYEFIYKVAHMYATKITNLSNDN